MLRTVPGMEPGPLVQPPSWICRIATETHTLPPTILNSHQQITQQRRAQPQTSVGFGNGNRQLRRLIIHESEPGRIDSEQSDPRRPNCFAGRGLSDQPAIADEQTKSSGITAQRLVVDQGTRKWLPTGRDIDRRIQHVPQKRLIRCTCVTNPIARRHWPMATTSMPKLASNDGSPSNGNSVAAGGLALSR